jgi:hypothetical protein
VSKPTSLTNHAIERYIERHRQGWSWEAARSDLFREMRGAVLYEQPPGEDPIYRTQSGRLLVVSLDGAVRTVLPAGSRATNRRPRR